MRRLNLRAMRTVALLPALASCGGRASVEVAAPADAGAIDAARTESDAAASIDAAPAGGDAQAGGCIVDPDLPPDATVIACGFAPEMSLVGADDEAVYVLTAAGQFVRVDTSTFAKSALYSLPDEGDGDDYYAYATGIGVHEGRIYFGAGGDPNSPALVSIGATTPSAPETVVPSGVEIGSVLVAPDALYWTHQGVGYLDAIYSAPYAGGPGVSVLPQVATPIASEGGCLYAAVPPDDGAPSPYGQLWRVPLQGGTSSVVIDSLESATSTSTIGDGVLAVDASHAYLIGPKDANDDCPLEQYALGGGAPTTLAEIPQPGGEVPFGPPENLCLDGDYAYFSQGLGGEGPTAVVQWQRVPTTASAPSSRGLVMEGAVEGKPAFDSRFIYLAYERGGVTGPIEGAILRVPK